MIRSKPSTDAYREAWELVFGKQLDGALRDAADELDSQRVTPEVDAAGIPKSWHPAGAAEKIKAGE